MFQLMTKDIFWGKETPTPAAAVTLLCCHSSAACKLAESLSPWPGPCSCRWDRPGNHFYHCTPIMTHSGDQCTAQALSQQEEKSHQETLRSCGAHQPHLDITIVLQRDLNAYLHQEEDRLHCFFFIYLSQIMFCRGQAHYWQWRKQLFWSEAERKAPNKDGVTELQRVHKSLATLISLMDEFKKKTPETTVVVLLISAG